MKKSFDWDKAAQQHNPQWVAWLKAYHCHTVTLAEYMQAYRSLRQSDKRPHKAYRYGTARLRARYESLRETFGFFI